MYYLITKKEKRKRKKKKEKRKKKGVRLPWSTFVNGIISGHRLIIIYLLYDILKENNNKASP